MIPIKNVFYMLAYCLPGAAWTWNGRMTRPAFAILKAASANAEDLLAAILILGVEEQFKRGVSRAYIEEEAPLSAVKGAPPDRGIPSGRAGEMRVSCAPGMNSRLTPT